MKTTIMIAIIAIIAGLIAVFPSAAQEGQAPKACTMIKTSSVDGVVPFTVNFNAAPAGGTPPYSYNWDFGDGGNATTQNPTHTYTTAGTYTATVTVTDSGSQQATCSNTIHAYPAVGVNCSATPQSGDAPLEITFSSQGTGGDGSYTYDWDFGDGNTSTQQNPIHTYPTAGTYTATVTVTSLAHTATCSRQIDVGAACTPPAITTHPTSTTICAGQSTTLSVTATGTGPLHYQWYKGAGTGNPVGTDSNSFTTPNLTVTTSYWCRVSNSCGSADSNMATVTVNPPTAITAWSANQTVLQVGESTTLSGTLTGTGLSWTISQVGGTGSGTVTPSSGTGTNVSSSFTATGAGTVNLRLTATGDCGTANQTLVLTVTAPNHDPSIDSLTADSPIFVNDTSNISGTTSDIDGDTVSWTLSIDAGSTASGVFTGPTSGTGDINSGVQATNLGTLIIRVDANDGNGGTATRTVSITVQ
jgi:PKD repeat protein